MTSVVAAAAVVMVLAGLPVVVTGLNHGLFDRAIQRALRQKLGRSIQFSHLEVRFPGLHPTLSVSDLVIGSPPAISPADLLRTPRLWARLQILPLLEGQLRPTDLMLQTPVLHLVRLSHNRNNYRIGAGGPGRFLSKTRSLSIAAGSAQFDDPERQVVLKVRFSHSGDPTVAYPFRVSGDGVDKGSPLTLVAQGAGLNRRPVAKPYPLIARLVDGATLVELDGSSIRPFDFSTLDVQAHVFGPNLADLSYLFNLHTPNSTPYDVTAHVERDGPRIHVTHIRAKLGRSDAAGEILSDHVSGRRNIQLNLRFGTLYLEDARALIEPRPPHAISRSQSGAAPRSRPGPLLTERPLRLDGLKAANMDVALKIGNLAGAAVAARDIQARAQVKDGRMTAGPIAFSLERAGRGRAWLTLDTSRPAARVTLAGSVTGLRIESLSKQMGKSLTGTLDAAVRVEGRGASMKALASAAQGRLAVQLHDGAFTRSKADALAGDLVHAIGQSIGDRDAKTPLQCAVADLVIANGSVRPDRLTIVTAAGVSQGEGSLSIGPQRLALEFHGQPAQRRVLQLNAPVRVVGPIGHPKVQVLMGQVLKREGPKRLLALVVSPIAGLLPTAGRSAPPPNCRALLDQSKHFVGRPSLR
ncbi:AsmA family protein [Caulobacter sp. S45]|uniref:AsmA family protein n=1 Tax=Caulobacter sp. S45 TaxID=1641861 RepID=UPI00131DFAC8|nr:AsmA family protein [Caulobacter sp. S45]